MKDIEITKAEKKLIDILYPLGLGVVVLLFLLLLDSRLLQVNFKGDILKGSICY